MDKRLLREMILEQKEQFESRDTGVERSWLSRMKRYAALPHVLVISGLRRCGKSTLLAQIRKAYYKEPVYYFNFEDERLSEMTSKDLNDLYELFLELYGEGKVFFLDEIQNVSGWEAFVRRMRDQGFKLFITGSNASLLSREIGTRLTGRYLPVELYPFSFAEFLRFKGHAVGEKPAYSTKERATLKRYFNEYLRKGGLPEFLRYEDRDILKALYDDILYRDIVARYEIKEIKTLRDLSLYLLSNTGAPFSYNRLKTMLGLGSVNTIRSYVEYLENTYLLATISPFSYSVRKQIAGQKKAYGVDNGLLSFISFRFSENRGRFLENLVFVELKRRGQEVYYYKTGDGREVDFLIKEGPKVKELIQVTQSLGRLGVKEREVGALLQAMKEVGLKRALLLTEEDEMELKESHKAIEVRPIYKWLLAE